MATFKTFEELDVWQSARKLNKEMYPFFISLQDSRNYELYRQMEKSAGSVMDNIAEGFERNGNREFVQFLSISKASAGELRSQLYRAFDRELINNTRFEKFKSECETIGDKIGKFMTYLNQSEIRGTKFIRKNTPKHNGRTQSS